MSNQLAAFEERKVEVNGVYYFMKTAGHSVNPLVLFIHGFPDSWYSWRHQLGTIAEAGYFAVAIDQLGYGESAAPLEIERYSQDMLAQDLADLIVQLGYESALIVGHDLGASLAWQLCLLHPERVQLIIALSIPYGGRALTQPTVHMRKVFADHFFYMLYFQEPGVAELELEKDIRITLLKVFTISLYRLCGGGVF